MGAINIKHTGSGSDIALSSDGTSLLLDGTAIGGGGGGGASAMSIAIKTADYTVVSGDLGKIIKYAGAGSDRTVTLTAGASLGDGFYVTISNANTGADERVVIDANGIEKFGWSNGPQTITLSRGELVKIIWDNTSGRWIIGEGGFNLAIRSDINPSTSTAVGDGTNSGIALGYNAQSAGSQAIALGRAYASGTDSFAANISSNSSSYGASGSGAAAIMNWAKATGSNSGAFGFGANATNWGAHALGAQTFATGDSSVSLGRNSLASATYSICIGNAGQNNIESSIKFSGSQHANQGDAQIGLYPLMADTTDATATAMVTNHATRPGASTVNQIVLPNNSAYAFHGTIVARQKAGDGTACAAWKIEGLIRREANAGTTVLVNSATTVLDNTPSWGMALSADTTNGCLKIQVTGAASTNIRWTTSITTSELTYA